MGNKIIKDRKCHCLIRRGRFWRLIFGKGICCLPYLGIPERPTGDISKNILPTFPHGASARHAPVKLSGLLCLTCHSCVTHAAPLFVQRNVLIKLTDSTAIIYLSGALHLFFARVRRKSEVISKMSFSLIYFAMPQFYKLAQMYGYITHLLPQQEPRCHSCWKKYVDRCPHRAVKNAIMFVLGSIH